MATVSAIRDSLKKVVANNVKHSVFLWGAPGIGKSSVVQSVASELDMQLIDLRISQLAPTDLRGLPYIEDGLAKFAPPSFLPTEGTGILFLDEANQASPSMMALAQQLILDRQVGDYKVPAGWFIVAAGNRTSDRAAVSQMPAPVANRFIHFEVESDLASWKEYAIASGVDEQIISFMNFRPELLFKFEKNATAWPSPRSWSFADTLLQIGLDIAAAVGEGASAEFRAYQTVFLRLPDVDKILSGEAVDMPTEPSLMYAVCGAIVARARTANDFFNGMKWLLAAATEDYVGLYMSDAMVALKAKNLLGAFVKIVSKDKDVKNFMTKYQSLLKMD